jgi:hypothetical protein
MLLADGSRSISDLAVLRDQPTPFGPAALTATVWGVLGSSAAARSGRRGRALRDQLAVTESAERHPQRVGRGDDQGSGLLLLS